MAKPQNWLVGIIIVLLVIGGVWYGMHRTRVSGEEQRAQTQDSITQTDTAPTAEATPVATATEQPPATKPTPKLSYEQALKKYGSNRIQLDANCQAIPSRAVYKNGTAVMLDNRAGVSRKVVFNLKSYTIPAYDYIVVSASASKIPGVTYLDCADRQNVATINIE